MEFSRPARSTLAILAVTVAIGGVVSSARAASHTETTTVGCDAGDTTTLVTLNHKSGALKFTQNDTDANLNSNNWAMSGKGNNLSKKATTDGQTVTWTGVKASNYTFKTKPIKSVDCNWIFPGNGTTNEKYTARTNQ